MFIEANYRIKVSRNSNPHEDCEFCGCTTPVSFFIDVAEGSGDYLFTQYFCEEHIETLPITGMMIQHIKDVSSKIGISYDG